MRKVKQHLCKTCGDIDSKKFKVNEKSTCRVCRNDLNKQYDKQYRQDNKEVIRERKRKYAQENKETISERMKQYRKENKEALNDHQKQYKRERFQTDPGFKYLHNLRNRQRKVFKGKLSTTDFLGCSSQELRDHFESLFQEGMTHDNHGEWHMDHIIPLSTAEVDNKGEPIDSEHNRMLFHYTNLQPLWSEDNLKKGDKSDYLYT